MALVECPECGTGVSDRAESCPKCAYPLAELAILQNHRVDTHTIVQTTTRRGHRQWVVLLLLAAAVATRYAPIFSLWFGIILLVLCITSYIPVVQDFSRRLLRINANEQWRNRFRVTVFGMIGVVLILASPVGFEQKAQEAEYKTTQERIAVEKSAEKTKKRKLTKKANSQVVASVKKAEEAWQNGHSFLAEQILEFASNSKHASDLKPIRQLLTKMANAKVEKLVANAKNDINDGYIDAARKKVRAALALPHADAMTNVNKLDQQIVDATDTTRIRTILMNLSDDDFQKYQESGDLPKRLVSGYEPLDNNALVMAKSQLTIVADAREKRRQEDLEQKRIAAEVAREVEEERKARQLAAAEAAKKAEKERKRLNRIVTEAKRKTEHNERIERGFSVWDGSHKKLTKLIQKSMNDPDSYTHVETVYSERSDHLIVKTTFRGKNAFGGVVINWVMAKVDFNGNIIQVISQGP